MKKILYLSILLSSYYVGYAQDTIKGWGPMSEVMHLFTYNDECIKFEFVPRSQTTKLVMNIYNFSNSFEIKPMREFLIEFIRKRENHKIIFAIDKIKTNEIMVRANLLGVYAKHHIFKAEEDIEIHFFNNSTDIQDKTVPFVLLLDKKKKTNPDILNRILKYTELEKISKKDFEYLKANTNTFIIITYKQLEVK